MKRLSAFFLVILASSVAQACGGGGAGGPRTSRPERQAGVLINKDLGRVNPNTFSDAMNAVVVRKYAHTLRQRREQFQTLTYEFDWRLNDPTPEERTAGYTGTRYRITIQGRRVGGSNISGTSVMFRMNLRVEYQARSIRDTQWHPAAALGESVAETLERMVSDLELEVRTGVNP